MNAFILTFCCAGHTIKALLDKANLHSADFSGATIIGTDFTGAKMRRAKFRDAKQLENCTWNVGFISRVVGVLRRLATFLCSISTCRRETVAKLGRDDRAGYKDVGTIEGYDKWASTYERDPNPLVMLEQRVTLELIGNVKGKCILDLGCGTGRYCALLTERGATVVGIDPSSEMLEQAKRKLTPLCRFELRHGTIEEMDFLSEHFDVVVSALTLSHIPELESILAESVRVLKSDGAMFISDIHPYWPVSGHDYTEFFDETGQEYRIPEYPHLVEEYWRLFHKFCMRLEDIREPKIDSGLIEHFPSLEDYRGIPLAIVLKARRLPRQNAV